jgi:hypothetical protein
MDGDRRHARKTAPAVITFVTPFKPFFFSFCHIQSVFDIAVTVMVVV